MHSMKPVVIYSFSHSLGSATVSKDDKTFADLPKTTNSTGNNFSFATLRCEFLQGIQTIYLLKE